MNEQKEEDIEMSKEESLKEVDSKMSLEEMAQREEKYKALVDFFKKDMEIKTTLMNLAPKSMDEYSEDSRIDYLDKLFSELKDIKIKFNEIARNFNKESNLEQSFNRYFDKAEKEIAELGYGHSHESLRKIYQMIFTDMKPELLEKVKENFCGYKISCGGLIDVSKLIDDVGSINELLHITHSSIVNDENLLQSMPVIETKNNSFGYDITLYGEENEISKRIYENFSPNLDVGWTDIVSMDGRTLMMVRDRGHALTIDIDSSDKDKIDVRYFVPKICNIDMIKALPGINESSITNGGATGFFVSKGEEIAEKIYNFIEKVPTDNDIPEIKTEHWQETEGLEYTVNSNNTTLFSVDDAKNLATTREKGKIRKLFARFKEFIKKNSEKSKGEDKENGGQDR